MTTTPPVQLPPEPQRIAARRAEVGEMPIARMLPSRERRRIGAWCFLDHAGPVDFAPGQGMRVGPHPHTALQTFTWMIEGEMRHSDSLGNVQVIRPGEVNLMSAGHGISHAEFAPDDQTRLHTAQLWIALPPEQVESAPAFQNHADLPRWREGGAEFTLLVGRYGTHQASPQVYTPLLGVDVHAREASAVQLQANPAFEHGFVALEGEFELLGQRFGVDELAYQPPGCAGFTLSMSPGTRLLWIGGEPFAGDVSMWWNFVGPDKAHNAQAQADWEAERAGREPTRFGLVPGFAPEDRMAAPPLPAGFVR